MLDVARSMWHDGMTSRSEDVIYEDVCTWGGRGGFSSSEPWVNMRDMHERLQMRWSVVFHSCIFRSAVGNEGKKGLWKFPESVRCEWEEQIQGMNCFLRRIILSVSLFFWQINHHFAPDLEVLFFCKSYSFSFCFDDTKTAVTYNCPPLVCYWEINGYCCVTL